MNGFANSLITLLMGWVKSITGSLWKTLGNTAEQPAVSFFSQNWKWLVLAIVIFGICIDAIIYFFRWRPDWVWSTKWRKLRKKREQRKQTVPEETATAAAEQKQDVLPQETLVFDRKGASLPEKEAFFAPPSFEPEPFEPVFDEPLNTWAEGDTLVKPLSFESTTPQEALSLEKRMDLQNGFARPVATERLYMGYQTPVHPGLDSNVFQAGPETEEKQERIPQVPTFHPFTETAKDDSEAKAGRVSRLAKRARNLVGLEDDADRPTVRDLQQTVDVTQAFREPVYPKNYPVQRG